MDNREYSSNDDYFSNLRCAKQYILVIINSIKIIVDETSRVNVNLKMDSLEISAKIKLKYKLITISS